MADTASSPARERSQKKAERRAKQREANPKHAEKMHRIRLEKPIPRILPSGQALPRLNIGCSGWFYWGWRGAFYPEALSPNEWISHYAKSFGTVEINASFYNWPTVAGVRAWLRGLPPGFIYSVKANELITHIKHFKDTKTLIADFGYIADLVGEHMGCLLFQLPPSIKYSPALLRAIVSQLEPGRRNVVEFRDPSWWNAEVYAALRDCGIMFCACSGPGLPDDLIKTHDEVYLRLHGVDKWYDYRYSEAELADWAKRLGDSGAKRLWVYFNNDYHGHAIDNARTLRDMLGGA